MANRVQILLNGSKVMVDEQTNYEALCHAAGQNPASGPTIAVMPLYAKGYTLLPGDSCELTEGMSVHVHRTGNA